MGHWGISRMISLMRCYVYWSIQEHYIEESVESCTGYILAVRSPTTKWQPWRKTDAPWAKLKVDYTDPLNGPYYLVVVDIFFSK